MDEKITLEDIFSYILQDYFEVCGVEPFSIRLLMVRDMWKGYADIRPDHARKHPEMKASQKNVYGTAVPPKKFGDPFTVLLSEPYVLNGVRNHKADWIGALVHEAVHVHDSMQFARMTGIKNYDKILDKNRNRMFWLWTEFHAKATGYYFERKYTFRDVRDESQRKRILEMELPYLTRNMFVIYHGTDDRDRKMYFVVHFIAILHVFHRLFPDDLTEERVGKIFVKNRWMYELYAFLSTHTVLEEAYRDFHKMKLILRKR